MYAINAKIFEIQPLSLYLLNEIKVMAIIKKPIPAKETHIFIIGFTFVPSPYLKKSTMKMNFIIRIYSRSTTIYCYVGPFH